MLRKYMLPQLEYAILIRLVPDRLVEQLYLHLPIIDICYVKLQILCYSRTDKVGDRLAKFFYLQLGFSQVVLLLPKLLECRVLGMHHALVDVILQHLEVACVFIKILHNFVQAIDEKPVFLSPEVRLSTRARLTLDC
jgi:hypothetical protein